MDGQQAFDDKGYKDLYKRKFHQTFEPSPPGKNYIFNIMIIVRCLLCFNYLFVNFAGAVTKIETRCSKNNTKTSFFCGNEMRRIVAKQLRVPNSSSGVSDQQSVGSSPDHGTCVLEQETLSYLFIFTCTRIGSARKRTQNTYH